MSYLRPSLVLSVLLLLFAALACGGAPVEAPNREAAASSPAAPARTAAEPPRRPTLESFATIWSGSSVVHRFEVIDADLSADVLAARLELAQDNSPHPDLVCRYAGMSEPNRGVRLHLLPLRGGETRSWEVYRSPDANDEACTSHDESSAELTLAKAAMALAGLDDRQRMELVPAKPVRNVMRPAGAALFVGIDFGEDKALHVSVMHESEDGFHSYTAEVRHNFDILARRVHSPNPAQGGSGEIKVLGGLRQGDLAVVVLEETWGPGGRWSTYVFTPPLELRPSGL